MKTRNNFVALSKFPSNSLKTEVRGGFAFTNKKTLQELTVVLPCNEDLDFQPGDKVYVRFDCAAHSWAKEVFSVEDKEFILCPKEFVILHEKG